jgi:hypothetical protein
MGKTKAAVHIYTHRGSSSFRKGHQGTTSHIYQVMLFILWELLWKKRVGAAFLPKLERMKILSSSFNICITTILPVYDHLTFSLIA